ncbi:MAG: cell division protein ZapA [Betaproteobacteria bacterium]|nr:cell division protein ZapA [Betaproteobacteria bacterium]
MSAEQNFLDVVILGREYRVVCPPAEQEALSAAVSYVDTKMQEIAAKGKNVAAERVAVMAALNIAHELLSGGGNTHAAGEEKSAGMDVDGSDFQRRIESMESRLDSVLSNQNPLF